MAGGMGRGGRRGRQREGFIRGNVEFLSSSSQAVTEHELQGPSYLYLPCHYQAARSPAPFQPRTPGPSSVPGPFSPPAPPP